MDVDAPNILKRSSSAPLINEATSTVATSPTINTAPRNTLILNNMFSNNNSERPRRFSFSATPLGSPATSAANLNNSFGPRRTPRVNQLRAEEFADVRNTREVAHEREIHNAMQMGQSCEDLTLVAGLANSPTRTQARFNQVVSPSSSSKSQCTRRSLSPVPIRPATLSPARAKRRADGLEELAAFAPRPKRACLASPASPPPPAPPAPEPRECTFRPVSPRRHAPS